MRRLFNAHRTPWNKLKALTVVGISVAALSANISVAQSNSGDDLEASNNLQAQAVAALDQIPIEEAVRRTKLQASIVEQTDIYERDPNYSGSWIKRSKDSFRVYYAFKGGKPPSDIADVNLRQVTQIVNVPVSLRDFDVERERIGKILIAAGIQASVSYNTERNKIIISSNRLSVIQQLLKTRGLAVPGWVEFDSGQFTVVEHVAVSGGGAISGSGGICAGGLTVTGSSGRGITTAEHCTKDNPTTLRGSPIGTRQGGMLANGIDVAWWRRDGDTYPNTVTFSGGTYTITEAPTARPTTDTIVCIVKRNNSQKCSYVAEGSFYPTLTDGPYVRMDRLDSEPGDSGAPWIYSNIAYGINKGEVCRDGKCYGHFTPVSAFSRLNLTVNTR